MKPAGLKQAEKAMWDLLLQAASGMNRANELETFFEKTSNISSMEADVLQRDWFLKGKSPMLTAPTVCILTDDHRERELRCPFKL